MLSTHYSQQILNDRFPMVTFPGFRVKKRFEDVMGTCTLLQAVHFHILYHGVVGMARVTVATCNYEWTP